MIDERLCMSLKGTKYLMEQKNSFQDQDYLYIVMEFMNGGSLDDLLLLNQNNSLEEERDKKGDKIQILPFDVIKWIIQELIFALDELYINGFVHRYFSMMENNNLTIPP